MAPIFHMRQTCNLVEKCRSEVSTSDEIISVPINLNPIEWIPCFHSHDKLKHVLLLFNTLLNLILPMVIRAVEKKSWICILHLNFRITESVHISHFWIQLIRPYHPRAICPMLWLKHLNPNTSFHLIPKLLWHGVILI